MCTTYMQSIVSYLEVVTFSCCKFRADEMIFQVEKRSEHSHENDEAGENGQLRS